MSRTTPTWDVTRLPPKELVRVAEIDRSEDVRIAYEVVDGRLSDYPVEWVVPDWHREGDGDHTLHSILTYWQPVVDGDGVLLAVDTELGLAGMAIVDPVFETDVAWMAFLQVDRRWRRRGVDAALWDECERPARATGARAMCVSAVRSGPAMAFYLSRGCELAAEPHPELASKEPDDLQLEKELS